MKNKMFLFTTGVVALVVVLMIIIVTLEPPKDGINRAQAFKAAALLSVSRQECEEHQKEAGRSHFSAKEQGNWFVKYMDYLYDSGYLNEELTPATLSTAQGLLTYKEAAYLAANAGSRFKAQVGLTKRNRDSPFPQEAWWKLFDSLEKELDPDGKVVEVTAVLYGTPSNLDQAASWTAYTTEGDYGFEGLALDAYMDCKIRFLAREGEMVTMEEQVSDEVTYENVWLTEGSKDHFKVYLGSMSREFTINGKMGKAEDLENNLADLVMSGGRLSKIIIKKDRINGKVLSVTDTYIEVEGYGRLELAPNFHVYKLYGDFKILSLKDILVGYNLQEFVAAGGKLCGALVERKFDAKTIRVLLMDDGFKNITHQSVDLTVHGPAVLEYDLEPGKTGSQELADGDRVVLSPGDKRLAGGRLVIRPSADNGITINSINRSYGNPTYSGSLEVRETAGGLVLVNDLYLEDYLKKVVPSEMPAFYEKEALKAQAVCARTYAYRQIRGNAYSQYGAHVDDSTNYQVYNNVASDEKTDAAVKETYGQMMFYGDQAVEAFYFSTSCGHTTDGSIWGSEGAALPYLQAVELRDRRKTLDLTDNEAFSEFIKNPDIPSYDSGFSMYRWNTEIDAGILSSQISGVGQVQNLTVTARGAGGIAKEVLVEGSEGSVTIKGQSDIRAKLGNPALVFNKKDGKTMEGSATLPSAFIAIEKMVGEDGAIRFKVYGGGYGHGVGMSQNGAQGMAKEGKSYQQILDFFYKGAELREEEPGLR